VKALVIMPTYRERETLPKILPKVLANQGFDLLIVDDNSPDGTAEIAREWSERDTRVNLMEREGKLGLGTAYIAGFKWGLERGYDCFVEMDADLSHNPDDLPRFLEEIEDGSDLVIGSRYVRGTISVIGWDFQRLLLSKFGNFYATTILKIPLTDITSGFRAFSKNALEQIDLDRIHSEGYSFQIELAYLAMRKGLKVKEIPIIFTERERGQTKMSWKIVREAVRIPWKLRLWEFGRWIKNLFLLRPGVSHKNEKDGASVKKKTRS
jgi:dolichol-phosphate mannosyltransferase